MGVVIWLVGDDVGYIFGVVILVDGGFGMGY